MCVKNADATTIYIALASYFLRGPAHPSPLFRSSNPVSLWLQKRKFNQHRKQDKYFCSISDQLFRGPRCPWPRLRLPGSRARQRRSVQSFVPWCGAFKPDGGTVGLGGTIVRAASTAWLLNSFPPLETELPPATWPQLSGAKSK